MKRILSTVLLLMLAVAVTGCTKSSTSESSQSSSTETTPSKPIEHTAAKPVMEEPQPNSKETRSKTEPEKPRSATTDSTPDSKN